MNSTYSLAGNTVKYINNCGHIPTRYMPAIIYS